MKTTKFINVTIALLSAALLCAACGKGIDNDPKPLCAITEPVDGAMIDIEQGLIVRGTFAGKNGGPVKQVTLRCGDQTETGIVSSPFVHAVKTGLQLGALTISIEVEDGDGEKASHSVTVVVVEPGMAGDSFVDKRDGSRYGIVQVGDQTWMAENLRYLPYVNVDTDFDQFEPRMYIHEYKGTDVNQAKTSPFYNAYGVYYNFPAALDGCEPTRDDETGGYVRGICPEGWHLPMKREWQQLHDYVADNDMLARDRAGNPIPDAVGKALASSSGWQWPLNPHREQMDGDIFRDQHLNNATGFNGKPVGFLGNDEVWYHENESCGWWSSQVDEQQNYYSNPTRMWSSDKYFIVCIYIFPTSCGFPVRCLKD